MSFKEEQYTNEEKNMLTSDFQWEKKKYMKTIKSHHWKEKRQKKYVYIYTNSSVCDVNKNEKKTEWNIFQHDNKMNKSTESKLVLWLV